MRILIILGLLVGLAGCSSSGSKSSGSRYSIKQDHGPSSAVNLDHVKDAVPRAEPKSRGGNKSPYRVLGKTYHVMPSAVGYNAEGTASWYGKKFHGHLTSNGEVYDMYEMSAAHKSLPLPTYLRVTNLANGRQVVVRVNDRGPFHGKRLIDLSYAAAYKLDMLKAGTARVRLEAISPGYQRVENTAPVAASVVPVAAVASAASTAPANVVSSNTPAAPRVIQVGSYSSDVAAQRVKQHVGEVLGMDVNVVTADVNGRVYYRVHAGPLADSADIQSLNHLLERAGYSGSRVVDLP